MNMKWLLLASTLGFSPMLLAEPAPWYSWMSKADSKIVCAQTSPGEGWVRLGGPYRTARCSAGPR